MDRMALYANRLPTTQEPPTLSNPGAYASADGTQSMAEGSAYPLPTAIPINPMHVDSSEPDVVHAAFLGLDDSSVSSNTASS